MAKIRIVTGDLIDPFDPKPEDIKPHAFIHSISLLNRFTGNSAWPYSVGMHTLALMDYVPVHLKRAALVHDWSEAWFNDLASPVKFECHSYKTAEKRAGLFIADVMGVSPRELEELDIYDKRIYADERDAMFPDIKEMGMGDEYSPLGVKPAYFQETPWRHTRSMLWVWFENAFPEWSEVYHGDYPFS